MVKYRRITYSSRASRRYCHWIASKCEVGTSNSAALRYSGWWWWAYTQEGRNCLLPNPAPYKIYDHLCTILLSHTSRNPRRVVLKWSEVPKPFGTSGPGNLLKLVHALELKLTPCIIVLENLIIAQLVKKFVAFYATRRLIIVPAELYSEPD
jgi:hypothetical protein